MEERRESGMKVRHAMQSRVVPVSGEEGHEILGSNLTYQAHEDSQVISFPRSHYLPCLPQRALGKKRGRDNRRLV